MKIKAKFIYIILISLLSVICLVVIYELFSCKANVNQATANSDKKNLQKNEEQSISNEKVVSQKYNRTMSFEEAIACKEYKEKALDDYKNNKMKFYYFGISYPTKDFYDKMKSHNVEIISKNCIPVPELLCYNETILELIGEK